MKLLTTLSFIILNVSFLFPFGWERVYPEITSKVREIKYLSVVDPLSVIFALDVEGLGYYKDSLLQKFKYDTLPVISVEFVDSLTNEILCAMGNGTANDGLYKFNKESETFSLIISSDSPNFVRKLDDGKYYFGSKQGLFYSDDLSTWQSVDSLIGKNIFDASYYQYNLNKKFIATDGDKLFYFENDTLTTYDPDLQISDLCDGFLSLNGGSYSDGIYSINYNHVLDLYCDVNNPDKLGWFSDVGLLVICQNEDRIYYIKSSEYPNLTEITACPFDYNAIYCSETYPTCGYPPNFIIGTDTGVYKYENEVGIENNGNDLTGFELYQNYPNPFNPVTQIKFDLTGTSNVRLSVFNVSGQLVSELTNKTMNAGTHTFEFDGSRLNSGVYYYTLEVNGKSYTKKMILMK